MENYELTLLAPATLNQEELNSGLQGVASFIQDQGGMVTNQDTRGRRVLPIQINKQKEAYLVVMRFSADPATIQTIQGGLRANPAILRHALLAWKPKKISGKIQEKPSGQNQQTELPEPKVQIADIDRQLEELFGEKKVEKEEQDQPDNAAEKAAEETVQTKTE